MLVNDMTILAIGLAVLSLASGMLGLGVAFAAVPFLGLFLHDLVHEVQPLSLLLNGITALFALFGFAESGLVMWRPAIVLAIVTTIAAPLGGYLAQIVSSTWLWMVYFVAVAYLAYRMFLPDKPAPRSAGAAAAPEPGVDANLRLALLLAVPISVVAGMLGVGPGFLLLPALILVGYESKHAAAMNALAVTPPSFSALLPHLATARMDWRLTVVLLAIGAIGSFLGARITSLYVPGRRLKQLFGLLIVIMTAYKLYSLAF
ncbi:MAG: sulfite exporter TauE/SafE family protein [Steroidobacteraceae bacterium]